MNNDEKAALLLMGKLGALCLAEDEAMEQSVYEATRDACMHALSESFKGNTRCKIKDARNDQQNTEWHFMASKTMGNMNVTFEIEMPFQDSVTYDETLLRNKVFYQGAERAIKLFGDGDKCRVDIKAHNGSTCWMTINVMLGFSLEDSMNVGRALSEAMVLNEEGDTSSQPIAKKRI